MPAGADPLLPPATQHYNHAQKIRLNLCLGFADNDYAIAKRKLAGEAKGDVMASYTGSKNPPSVKMMTSLVDQVYMENFDNAWTQTIGFFTECGTQMAGTNAGQDQPSNFCMRQALVAAGTTELKNKGSSLDAIKKEYAFVQEPWLGPLTESVYAAGKDRMSAEMDAWDSCLASVSDD